MFWNFIIHQIFLWAHAATPWLFKSLHDQSRQTTGRTVPSTTCLTALSVVLLHWVLDFYWLGQYRVVPIFHQPKVVDSYWRNVTLSSILSFSSLAFTYCRRWKRAGRKCWAMTLLSWKIPWGWWIRSRRRIWQPWKHNRNEVLRVARVSESRFNEIWFLTIDPFIRIPVFIPKLSERFMELFHGQEWVQFFDIHRCLFMRLHFTIGGYDYRRTARLRQNIHFSSTQVLFRWSCALTLRSRQQILFPQVSTLMQASTYFPKVRRILLFLAPLFLNALLASLHAAPRATCSCHSRPSWDRSSNFGALGLSRWGSPGQIYPSEEFWRYVQ